MAMLIGDSTSSVPKSHVELEALQTPMPIKVTDPRLIVHIQVKDVPMSFIFNRRVHVVLYYNKASDGDSGYFVAGWLKESLGIALTQDPMLAGRVRRGEMEGGFEIVSNDGGVRFVEARMLKNLAEFVGARGEDKAESELVYWEDAGDRNLEFCPLLCVQVTNFLCGGYSIGISCSLLVADPFSIINFLKKWADIHHKLVYETKNPKIPLFYLPKLKPMKSSIIKQIGSNTFKDLGKTTILKTSVTKTLNTTEMNKALALQCVEKHGNEKASSFCLIAKELNGELKIEKVEKRGLTEKQLLELSCVNWDDLGGGEVTFSKGNKAVCVSSWINTISEDGLVFSFPFSSGSDSEIHIVVTLP